MVPPHPEVPGHRGERTHRRALGRCCALPPAYGLVVAVLVAVILALAIALAVQSAGRREGHLAPVLACPDGWVGYRNVCYCLSMEEGSWAWSQERCSSHGASLAVLQREWEMEFLSRLKGKADFWLGLWRQGEHFELGGWQQLHPDDPSVGPRSVSVFERQCCREFKLLTATALYVQQAPSSEVTERGPSPC
ncbi:early activation antigen CD69-like [Grus japonensis]|uniref:Early activation antigen CD69-like n=1 Tax=Grus japonensis TaxID=30415 RepID=A0ABC9XUU1_GRUJA